MWRLRLGSHKSHTEVTVLTERGRGGRRGAFSDPLPRPTGDGCCRGTCSWVVVSFQTAPIAARCSDQGQEARARASQVMARVVWRWLTRTAYKGAASSDDTPPSRRLHSRRHLRSRRRRLRWRAWRRNPQRATCLAARGSRRGLFNAFFFAYLINTAKMTQSNIIHDGGATKAVCRNPCPDLASYR